MDENRVEKKTQSQSELKRKQSDSQSFEKKKQI
jgi:hypothetical protein